MRLVVLLLLVFAALPASAARRFALVIGANAGEPNEVRLRYAESDAERMARILRDVGGFEASDVLLLTQVDAENVRRALIGLNARVRAERGEALLFVYYSGHGSADALHLAGSRFDMSELKELVSGSPAKQRVLVIDACRSGAITRIKGGHAAPGFQIAFDKASAAEGVAILTSSAAGEDSQESDEYGASIFTHYLASALLGAADHDGDGKVTLAEAFSYASERTLVASASTVAGPQHPTYRFDLGGRDDLVLTRPAHADRAVGLLTFPEAGSYLVSQGGQHGAVVAEVTTEARGARLALRPGSYFVTKRARDHLMQGEVRVKQATSTSLKLESLRRIDYAQVVRKGGTDRGAAWSSFAHGGVRGAIFDLGTSTYGGVGFRLDVPFLTVETRFGYGTSSTRSERLEIDTRELRLSMAGLRAFDFGLATVGVGVEAGIDRFDQRFHEAQTPDRGTWGADVGPVLALEVPLGGSFFLRGDGALLTYFLPGETPVSWRAGAGIGSFL